MPETSDGSDGAGTSNLVPNQLANLVPTFDPSKDEIVDYTKKVQLLMNMWPEGKWTELAPVSFWDVQELHFRSCNCTVPN